MATRSTVGIMKNDGTVESIYVHYDGYPEGVGKWLLESLKTDIETSIFLKKVGNIRSVECLKSIDNDGVWTDESYSKYVENSESCDAEFGYVMINGVWTVVDMRKKTGYILSDLLEAKAEVAH